jgi:ubiquinone/menaquinone biosynthesis C-methylase UbiE
MKTTRPRTLLPAAGRDGLLPLYDPALRWLMREARFKRRLIEQAAIRPGHVVLDLGCGTGTLLVMIRALHRDARAYGADGDRKVLAMARRKLRAAGSEVMLVQALAEALPFPDDTFDVVVSSLVFHHLDRRQKLASLGEVVRVLRPGGGVHVVDFGPASSALGGLATRLLLRGERARDNVEGRLPGLMTSAGLADVRERGRCATVFGSLSSYTARRA